MRGAVALAAPTIPSSKKAALLYCNYVSHRLRQKPLTNALYGLYLPYVDRMLEARLVEGCDEPLPGRGVHR